jgi:hypothetical protein
MMADDLQTMNRLFHAENVEEFSDALNYLLHRTHDKHLRNNAHRALKQAIAEHLERHALAGRLDVFVSIRKRICMLLQQFHPEILEHHH